MVMSTRTIAGLAVLSGLASAKIYAAPEATTSFNLPLDQFSPQPTKAPANAELRRRQTSAGTTVLVAPDNTCGYISGRAGAAYTCGTAASCIFFTSSSRPGFVACCDADDCGVRRTCYDARQVSTSSLCDGGCMVDKYTLKCTNTARPFCNTISFPGSIFDYWCNTVDISTYQAAVTTFEGQTGRSWAPLALTTDASSSLRAPSASGRFTATGSGSLVDPVASDPTNNGNNDNDNDSNNNNNNKSSTPVGAIVGGVVGGLAVIALVGLGIFLILRKKKQPAQPQQPQQPTVNQQPPMAQGDYTSNASPTQYPAAASHTHSFYDPKLGGPGGYPQNFGGTPPPQGGYQQPGYFVAGNMVPDRADTTSPGAVSQFTDNRYSTQTIAPGYQPQQPQPQQQQQFAQPQPTIHEAPATNDGHKGQMHELA